MFAAEILHAAEEITETSWETPYSTRVDSIITFQHSYADQDDLIVTNLVGDASALRRCFQKLQQQQAICER